jgi:cardiolipin hydrolase
MSRPDPDLLADLLSTSEDRRLTRSERRAVRAVLADHSLRPEARRALVDGLFAAAIERAHDHRDRALLDWLQDLVGLVMASAPEVPAPRAWFGPEEPMVEGLLSFLADTRASLDVAVFTLTDDRVSQALADLHARGVAVRLLSDNDKAHDLGSDIHRLIEAGLAVRVDRSQHHFHHKFAVRDGAALLTGSYNWTRGADRDNRENFLVTWEPALVRRYAEAFEQLWTALG